MNKPDRGKVREKEKKGEVGDDCRLSVGERKEQTKPKRNNETE